jgi:peroxiredoxin Q/BCP
MRISSLLLGVTLLAVTAAPGMAQQPAQAEVGPKVGDIAPDFEFTGITRYGVLATRHRLSDFRGQNVVLAFFPKARTRG